MEEQKKYSRIIDRLKKRNVNLKTAMLFPQPEILTLANSAIVEIEKRRNKRYSIKDYNLILNRLAVSEGFINNCKLYLNSEGTYTKPSLTFNRKSSEKNRYDANNLMIQKLSRAEKKIKRDKDAYEYMDRQMKNSPGYKFLIQFEDSEKVRFLFSAIKNHNNKLKYDFTAEQKRKYILKFYNDKQFNHFYKKFLETGNKFLKPSLDHKISRKNGGGNDLENLHFISYLENISKNDMNWDEWQHVKTNLKEFFV